MGFLSQDLRLTPQMGEAVGKWLRHRHPRDTAKRVAREVGVDTKTAENILSGHLSGTTFTRLLRAYGWPFLAQVGAAVCGETYQQSIDRELGEIADERRRLDEMEAGLRGSWEGLRARRSVDRGGLRLVAPEDDAPSWAAWNADGGLGFEASGRKS